MITDAIWSQVFVGMKPSKTCEVWIMGLRQIVRNKMVLSSSFADRDDRCVSEGWSIIHLTRRNAYELIGLRRPIRNLKLRLKAD